jgi:sRNA-binding carbon storage regulator CsrA
MAKTFSKPCVIAGKTTKSKKEFNMLILQRNPGEVIMLSDKETGEVIAEIRNCGVNGAKVKLGVSASHDVIVDRYEIHQRKIKEKEDHEHLLSA